MGNSNSSTAVTEYESDYELVVRVSKELDAFLDGMLDIQSRKRDGPHPSLILSLMDKIELLKESNRVSRQTIDKMKKLVRWRNELVHNPKINSLHEMGVDSFSFKRDYDTVKAELLMKKNASPTEEDNGGFSGLGFAAVVGVGLMALALGAQSSDETEEEHRRRHRHR